MSADFSGPVEVRVVRDFVEFNALREKWDALFHASATRAASLRFEWLCAWWREYGAVYGARGGGLYVVTVWSGDRLIGALPLYRRVTGRFIRHARLQFISTGEDEFEETCPEYMDLLAFPGHEQQVFGMVQSALQPPLTSRWDDVLLVDMAEDSALLSAWSRGAHDCSPSTASRDSSPIADLSGGFEAYLARLSANSRQQSRRALRDAERAGATLELVSTPDGIDACFDDLVRLHQARWLAAGKPGCFAAQRFTAFHRALARTLVPQSAAVLARLRVGDVPLAVIYGFLTAGKFDFYQSGVRLDGNSAVERPGIVAHLLLMSRLAEQGVTCYDFLRGTAEYKQRLATGERPLARLRLVRPTLRSLLWSAAMPVRRSGLRLLQAAGRFIAGVRGAVLTAVPQLCMELVNSPVLAVGAIV